MRISMLVLSLALIATSAQGSFPLELLHFGWPDRGNVLESGDGALSEPGATGVAKAGVLFSTFPGIAVAPYTVTSQNFTDASFTSQGADDFVVDGNGWTIMSVEVRGTYYPFLSGGPTGPADSVNVYILGDSGGLPDTTNLAAAAIYAAENLSYTDPTFGDFRVPLPGGGVTLPPGTYWLVVQANMGVVAGGQWGWTESAAAANTGTTVGSESAWFQSLAVFSGAGGGAPACVGAWGRRITDCDITIPADPNPPSEFDLAFELEGLALVPGVLVTPTALTTSESGVSDTFEVVLSAPPAGGNSVDVPIGTGDGTEGSVSDSLLTFTAADWDIPQTVTVVGVDDALADGDVAYSLVNGPVSSGDGAYDGLPVDNVQVTNQDDESAGITVSPVSGLVVSEDGTLTADFSVRLNTAPSPGETVTIPLSVSQPALAGLSTAAAMLTDTTPQMVTVTGTDDDVDNGAAVAFTVITGDPSGSGGSPYDLLTAADVADVAASRLDDDTAGITVTPTADPISTSETGTSATFDVVLASEPLFAVQFGVFSSDTSEGTVDTAMLTFLPGDWNMPQTVTVTGQDDLMDDGDVSYVISTEPTVSSDPLYNDLDPNDVAAVNLDDADTAGVTFSQLVGHVTEESGTDSSFSVVLDSEPLFFVTVNLDSGDATEGLLSTDGITFQPSLGVDFDGTNWNVPQMVTVRGQDDPVVDGDVTYLVESSIFAGDVAYDALGPDDVADVEVTNLDDDTAVGIPTLGEAGLATLCLILALAGMALVRRVG